jgi:tetratricopeptide (TPR) repeat protein
MPNDTHPFAQAENLRKEGRYPQAAQIFATLWQQQPDPRVGWRLAFCQRKQGRLDQAEAVARKALELAPGDPYIQSELGWVLYERYIKPARETGDLGRALYGARQILDLNPQHLLLKLVSQAMMKVGKDRGQWAVVEEWSARLDPADLDKEAREINGKKTMSEREVWYVQRARALLELGRYQEALETAQAGLQDFPDEFFLQRIAAQARAELGGLGEGITQFRRLLNHPHADWYVFADLAILEARAGQQDEAYRHFCTALLSTNQGVEYKLGYLMALADLAVKLNQPEVAALHVALVKAVRMEKGWKVSPEDLEAEQRVRQALAQQGSTWPDLPQDSKGLEARCRQIWKEGQTRGLTFYTGTLKEAPGQRKYTYIQPDGGGEEVFVLVRDLPRECQTKGCRVRYALEKTFDRKKNREAWRAVHVSRLKET